ncbi:MAG: hypothetical protein Q9213_001138 [Squamulea squamosa]
MAAAQDKELENRGNGKNDKEPEHGGKGKEEKEGEDGEESEIDWENIMDYDETIPDSQPKEEAYLPTEKLHTQCYAKHGVHQIIANWWLDPSKVNPTIVKINDEIKQINKDNQFHELRGQIPTKAYSNHYIRIMPLYKKLKINPNDEVAWSEFKGIRDDVRSTNMNRGLPEHWTIPPNFLKEKINVDDRTQISGSSTKGESSTKEGSSAKEGSSTKEESSKKGGKVEENIENPESDDESDSDSDSDTDSDSDSDPEDTSIERLKKRISRKYHVTVSGEVVAYKKCGSIGYQCLVKQENYKGTASTYRLAPSSEDKSTTPSVTTKQLGTQRDEEGKYLKNASDLKDIKWVAWQPDPRYKNATDNLNPDNWILPRDAPQVYCCIL